MSCTLPLDSRQSRGSVFRLTVPLATSAPATMPSVAETRVAQPLHVREFVVDDDETVRRSMLLLLRDWGCQCRAFDSLKAALSLVPTGHPMSSSVTTGCATSAPALT